jgi:hypothetical protein
MVGLTTIYILSSTAARFRSASLIFYELSSVERPKLQPGGIHPKAEGDDLRVGIGDGI